MPQVVDLALQIANTDAQLGQVGSRIVKTQVKLNDLYSLESKLKSVRVNLHRDMERITAKSR